MSAEVPQDDLLISRITALVEVATCDDDVFLQNYTDTTLADISALNTELAGRLQEISQKNSPNNIS